jgi:hypothetical protein
MRTSLSAAAYLLISACSDASIIINPPANRAPVFTSASAVTVAENTSGDFYLAAATDADGDALSYSITGGADATRFQITAAGALRFVSPPDFEAPADADSNNIYEATITANDGALTTNLTLAVTVADRAESFAVRRIAVGLKQPLFLLGRDDGTNRVFIVEKEGQVEILDLSTGLLNTTPFIDLVGSIASSGEQGLLGMALAPDYATSGIFYLHLTNLSGDTEVRRYQRSTVNPDLADLSSADLILTVAQPDSNHNGGWIGFGPDDLLYIALGDGGGSNDQYGNGQNLNSLLGKILRIDPSSDDFPADADRDYAIPSANSFAASGGAPEIFAYGLRNPFRASFDRQTGNLLIGDVGQGTVEEIDLIRPGEAGLNFGWPILEGTRVNQSGSTTGMTPPIAEYRHGTGPTEGNSVTGGYVYRGPVAPLQGEYVFGDFISNNLWSISNADISQGATISSSGFTVQTSAFAPDIGVIDSISSFGEYDAGNLFIIGIDGEVFQIVPS